MAQPHEAPELKWQRTHIAPNSGNTRVATPAACIFAIYRKLYRIVVWIRNLETI